jgi:hypothetical protein
MKKREFGRPTTHESIEREVGVDKVVVVPFTCGVEPACWSFSWRPPESRLVGPVGWRWVVHALVVLQRRAHLLLVLGQRPPSFV